mmetsp:Transcript_91915/g.231100  ORF Transcript_91915/g.231100 Transcript_91915/m.231100 type:complete len:97 (+) Transcript_91915:1695-1985(+)
MQPHSGIAVASSFAFPNVEPWYVGRKLGIIAPFRHKLSFHPSGPDYCVTRHFNNVLCKDFTDVQSPLDNQSRHSPLDIWPQHDYQPHCCTRDFRFA